MSAIRQPARKRAKPQSATHAYAARLWNTLRGIGRLCLPPARGVYHPQSHSAVLLGVALPPDADLGDVSCRLWWRGLGLVERNGRVIAGADVSAAVQQRHLQRARWFVTQQLRDAGVRGAVKRWE